MISAKRAGRAMGGLMLVQAVVGVTVNFVVMPVITGPPGFLINAAANSTQVGITAVLMVAAGALSIAISTTAWPVFRQHSERMALAYVAFTAAGLALAAAESASVMSMLSLSEQYAQAAGGDGRLFEVVGTTVRYTRYWAHYTQLIVGGGMLLLLYTTLLRFALVPRLLAAVGVAAVMLQITALSMPFFGYRINFYLLAPMGLCHFVLAFWLVAKGLADQKGSSE